MSGPGDADGAAAPVDRLLHGRVALAQPVQGYRVAVDPVLLAAAVPARGGDLVLDLGCGVGAAALCLLARVPEARVTGLELQSALAELARGNAAANGRGDSFTVHAGDLLDPPVDVAAGGFDHAMANPPYLEAERADAPSDPVRAAANVEGAAKLADWVRVMARLVRRKGTLTLVHRADRLDELLALLRQHAGGIVVHPLWPAPGRDAKRVIVQARVGIGGPMRLSPGLVLHEPSGGFTPEARAVLEEARALAP